MKILLLLVACIITITVYSQPDIDWQKTYGGNTNDIVSKITVKADGSGFFIAGSSNSGISGEKSQDSRGLSDYWVLSINSSGQIIWQKTIGGAQDDGLNALCANTDGSFLLGGVSYSGISGEKTDNSRGFGDYWLVKVSASGIIEWQKTIGGANLDILRSASQTSDGGYIIGGASNSNISGEKSENVRGSNSNYDYWILKLNSSGDILWQKTYGGESTEELSIIKQTSDMGYIVAGTSSSPLGYDKTENSKGGYDFWILKLDSDGIIQWQKTLGGNADDYAVDVVESITGGFYLAGNSYSGISADKEDFSRGGCDFWLLKLDGFGNIIWQKTIGGSSADFLYSLNENPDGSIILGGSSDSAISFEKNEDSRGMADMWLLRLNPSGNISWQKTIGGNQADNVYCIRKIADNGYILGGNSRSGISGEKSEISRGGTDYWVVKLNTDNLSSNDFNTASTGIYPNPTSGLITFDPDFDQNLSSISLTDFVGKKIKFEIISNNTIFFNAESGIYLFTIITENGKRQTFKILKL